MENNKEAMYKVPLCILVFTNFPMQNCLGLFTRGFLLHLRGSFNIIYLGYIICETAIFLFQIW